jgi:hypothetical protein
VPLWHTGRCQSDTRHPIGGGHDAETHQADRRFALTVPGQEVARGDLLIEIALVLLGIAEPVRPNQIDGEAIMVDERGLSAFDLLCSWRNCALPYAVGRAFSNNALPSGGQKKPRHSYRGLVGRRLMRLPSGMKAVLGEF